MTCFQIQRSFHATPQTYSCAQPRSSAEGPQDQFITSGAWSHSVNPSELPFPYPHDRRASPGALNGSEDHTKQVENA